MAVMGKAYCRVLLFLMGCCFLTANNASANCEVSHRGEIHFTIPQNLLIPRDIAWGTPLYESALLPISPGVGVKCDSSDEPQGLFNNVGGEGRMDMATIDGSNIGYRIYVEAPRKNYILKFLGKGSGTPMTVGDFRLDGFSFRLTLHWLGGAIKTGPAVKKGLVADYFFGKANPVLFYVDNQATFSMRTCVAKKDVSVSMGSQESSGFSGGKKSLTPVPFAINLDCEEGINSIEYQLDATEIVDRDKSIIGLNKCSTDKCSIASGIGVQILDDLGNPVPFGERITFYKSTNSAVGQFSIPLKAAYYKIADTVKAGTANTSLTFTMTYR